MSETDAMQATDQGLDTDNVVRLPATLKENPTGAVADFVRKHPVMVIAGGLAIGAIAASLLPKGTGRKIAKRAVDLAETATTAGLLFGQQMLETAESASEEIRGRSHGLAERAESIGEEALHKVQGIVAPAGDAASRAGRKIADKAGELKSRLHR
ncbi:MAG: hypothetical protein KDE55_14355 [Novosphingobium sp.]|nr:hypothetical protein [Novosphingobium sp.]